MLNNCIQGFNIPYYIAVILTILKFTYYYLDLLSFNFYYKCKNIIIDIGTGNIKNFEDIKNKISNVYYIDSNNQNIII